MSYDIITTIRYMGNKNRLLDAIIPEIESVTNPGDLVCDLMAGTNTIGYALKKRNRVLANDIQYYSYIVSKCLLGNYSFPTPEEAHKDLDDNIQANIKNKTYSFIVDNYTDTYFAEHQCLDIDSIRYAIDRLTDDNKKAAYLTILMSAMCKCQSSPGHFAQFMDKNSPRLIPLRKMSIIDAFYDKFSEFKNFVVSDHDNISKNLDYKDLFKDQNLMKDVKCIYLDSPYTTEQYSRFYHLLETVCKYDNPTIRFKAKYRDDRYMSDFCYKNKVEKEFENIISFAKNNGSRLIISYSNKGVLPEERLLALCKKYNPDTVLKEASYNHSTQGKGVVKIKELLFIL